MIGVEKIFGGLRAEGVNYGLPMTFVCLGVGTEYSGDDLVSEIWKLNKCQWICFYGEDTLQLGMGTVVRNLSALGLRVEIENDGKAQTPGWLNEADRWVVDYTPGPFSYKSLRAQDMIRIIISSIDEVEALKSILEKVRGFEASKYLVIPPSLILDCFDLVCNNGRIRIFVAE